MPSSIQRDLSSWFVLRFSFSLSVPIVAVMVASLASMFSDRSTWPIHVVGLQARKMRLRRAQLAFLDAFVDGRPLDGHEHGDAGG